MHTIVLMIFLAGSWAFANQTVERAFETTASPLQAYRALSEDWLYLQWSGARSAAFGGAPETPWRITSEDGQLREGILKTLEPAVALEYTMFVGELNSFVKFTFSSSPTGTSVHLAHEIQGEAHAAEQEAEHAAAMWEITLSKLLYYLNSRPGSYLALPIGENRYPALLLLHDRFGLSKTIRDVADSLAVRGYVVLAVDMFKGDRTSDLAQAKRFLELVQETDALAAIGAGWRALLTDSLVNRKKIGVLGTGYGADMALRALASEPSLRAGAAWYPSDTPPDSLLSRIGAPLVVLNPSMNGTDPSPQTTAMSQRFVQQAVRAEMLLIKGESGFAEPANGAAYSGAAFADAMRSTLSFFDRRLKL
ncbi:MAG: dienelactone hydrolase family protein [bacterium]|nr:dienelactone hydrolase family protein [bacterium]